MLSQESKNVVDAALGVLGINGFAEDGKSRTAFECAHVAPAKFTPESPL